MLRACLAMLLIATPAAGQQNYQISTPSPLVRGIGGPVNQPGERPYSVRAQQVGDRVAVDYPELNCGGTWKLVSVDGAESRYLEIIEYGQKRCVNYGIVVLKDIGYGRVAWTWQYDYYGGVAAAAVMQ